MDTTSLCVHTIIYVVVHIRILKQALKHGLKLKKIHKTVAFYKKSWLKPYIEMNTELKKKMQKMILKKTFTN